MLTHLARLQCEIGTISNGTWVLLDTTGSCATNVSSPDAVTLNLIQPGPGVMFYATNSSQC
jgi:hypothetical protein